MPTWEEKLFTIVDDLTHRIRHCCGTLDFSPNGSCGTCRIDGQLRGMLNRYISAGRLQRPAGMSKPAPLTVNDPLSPTAPGSGLPPLTEEEKEGFRQKLRGVSTAIAGVRG
jgi:hypothetical protein